MVRRCSGQQPGQPRRPDPEEASPPVDEKEHMKRVREVFYSRDNRRNGELDVHQLYLALQDLGVRVANGEEGVAKLLEKIDDNNNGTASIDEFEKLFDISRLRKVFDEIDEDGSGAIGAKELRHACQKLGVRVTAGDARRLIKLADKNGDGEVDWDEFVEAFEFTPLATLDEIAGRWSKAHHWSHSGGGDLAPMVHVPGLEMYQTILAGGMAGILSKTSTAPLERIKITSQVRGLNLREAVAQMRTVVGKDGWRALYAGNLANCIRMFPTGAINCTVYNRLLRLTPAHDHVDWKEPIWRLTCGGLSAGVANTLTYPMDVVRARLTIGGGGAGGQEYRGISDAFRVIVREEGYAGLFKGLRPTLAVCMPFVAVSLTSIDLMKNYAAECGIAPTPGVLMAIGAASGVLAQGTIFPLDVLRHRMQMGAGSQGALQSGGSVWGALKRVVAAEGLGSLYRGIVPTLIKVVPTVAVMGTVNQSTQEYYKAKNKERALQEHERARQERELAALQHKPLPQPQGSGGGGRVLVGSSNEARR